MIRLGLLTFLPERFGVVHRISVRYAPRQRPRFYLDKTLSSADKAGERLKIDQPNNVDYISAAQLDSDFDYSSRQNQRKKGGIKSGQSTVTSAEYSYPKGVQKRPVKELLKEAFAENISPTDLKAEFPSDVTNYYRTKYKSYSDWERDQTKHAYRPRIEPRETSLMLFPGQGSQFVGMGRKLLDFPNVMEMYNVAGKILGYDLLGMCLNGPKETLDKTVHCQPAILVTSLAAVEKLKEQNPWAIENCVSAAGYSVGEYSALVFAGALSFEDAVRLIQARAEAMQKASELVSSRMMTVTLHADSKVNFACMAARRYCTEELNVENAVCEISNYLYPGCKIIAGNTEALRFIEVNASEFGISRIQYLPVSGAFHTRLMLPAKQSLIKALSSVDISAPIIPVHSNVNAFKYKSASVISKTLVEQMHKPVRWEQTLHVLYARPQGDEFPKTFEVGPGRQLGAILRRVNQKAFEQYENVEV